MRQLIWFRTDLRVRDNTALHAAMTAGPTVAVFLLSATQWQQHHDAPSKVDFWLRNVQSLQAELTQLNVPLLIRVADTWDAVPEVLNILCHELQVDAMHLNQEYGVHETQRDTAVAQQLKQVGVSVHCHVDRLLFEPGTILTRSGGFFKVFTQFKNACYHRLSAALPVCLPTPPPQAPLAIKNDPLPATLSDFATPSETLRTMWPAGEQVALDRLNRFCEWSILQYDKQRDFPALAGTSQLSPYLAAGILSPRQCVNAAYHANNEKFKTGNLGVITWITELLWREFYLHIVVGFPQVSRHRPFREQTERVAWRYAPDELTAWQEGRTGFPFIDAAMRQLLATGWMHNRLRMVVAMFLTKNLLIDWRQGEQFFMRHLIDGDLAANNGGWQWSASTGTDAVPWFRLFNPITQSQRFDPNGEFIRHWLPELAHLDNKCIHDPSQLGGLFALADYPAPIVDLAASRERALNAFKAIN